MVQWKNLITTCKLNLPPKAQTIITHIYGARKISRMQFVNYYNIFNYRPKLHSGTMLQELRFYAKNMEVLN
jgi:hypothetical protein